ncbi:MAG: hypothetical protein LBT20_03120 [Clostridiales bacterium]|jgi:hypothetical protein|nr:hypothetical protein [Clostridiales bacterium]
MKTINKASSKKIITLVLTAIILIGSVLFAYGDRAKPFYKMYTLLTWDTKNYEDGSTQKTELRTIVYINLFVSSTGEACLMMPVPIEDEGDENYGKFMVNDNGDFVYTLIPMTMYYVGLKKYGRVMFATADYIKWLMMTQSGVAADSDEMKEFLSKAILFYMYTYMYGDYIIPDLDNKMIAMQGPEEAKEPGDLAKHLYPQYFAIHIPDLNGAKSSLTKKEGVYFPVEYKNSDYSQLPDPNDSTQWLSLFLKGGSVYDKYRSDGTKYIPYEENKFGTYQFTKTDKLVIVGENGNPLQMLYFKGYLYHAPVGTDGNPIETRMSMLTSTFFESNRIRVHYNPQSSLVKTLLELIFS